MKVLSEYPEAKMTSEQQSSSLGETFPELGKRLDEGTSINIALLLPVLYVSLLDGTLWTQT